LADEGPIPPGFPEPGDSDLGDFANRLTFGLTGALGSAGPGGWLVSSILDAMARGLAIAIRLVGKIASAAVVVIDAFLRESNPEFGQLAQTVVTALFGGAVPPLDWSDIMRPEGLNEKSAAVGQGVLEAIFGPFQGEGGPSLQPGADRLESYIAGLSTFLIRGWLIDVVTEFVPHFHLRFMHHLEQALVDGLGLGRVTRRALNAIVNILLTTPTEWQLNLAYRPKLMSPPEAIFAATTLNFGDDWLDDILGRQGYPRYMVQAFKAMHGKRLSAEDYEWLAYHQVISDDERDQAIVDLGYQTDDAALKSQIVAGQRLDGYRKVEQDLWLSKYEAGLITREQFDTALGGLVMPDELHDLLLAIGDARRTEPRALLTVAELKDGWNQQLISDSQLRDCLDRKGYSSDDADVLVLSWQGTNATKAEAAQKKADAAAKRAQDKIDAAAAKQAAAELKKQQAAAALQQRKLDALAQQSLALSSSAQRKAQAADATAQRAALVDAQRVAGVISTDQAAYAKALIDYDAKALAASIDAQDSTDQAAFQQTILSLQQSTREADIQEQLDDVDLSLVAITATRTAAADARLAAADGELASKLQDVSDLFDARKAALDDEHANILASIDIGLLPTAAARAVAITQKLADLDGALTRKVADTNTLYDARQATLDTEHDAGVRTDSDYQKATDALTLRRQTAIVTAQQQHDLAGARLRTQQDQIDPLTSAAAAKQQDSENQRYQKALDALGTSRLSQEQGAHQTHDQAVVRLTALKQQVGPISQAEAVARRQKIREASDAAARNEQIVATQIQKGEQLAQARIAKADASLSAAKQRLQLLADTSSTKEQAAAADAGARQTLADQLARSAQQLDADLAQAKLALLQSQIPDATG
jgi:hypothetical protein